MRLFLLTALTMTAFAANSILNRLAVDSGAIEPGAFATLRVAAGAVMLAGLVFVRGGKIPIFVWRRPIGALALAVYMIGFSTAYLTLDAGLGALVLFGTVQIAMFLWATTQGAAPTQRQMFGGALAFGGLVLVLLPGIKNGGADPASSIGLLGMVSMMAAGLGWAVYTLAGRAEPDPLAGTAANFVVCLPVVLGVLAVGGLTGPMRADGVILAVISGAVTSGLGYALWYTILPRLDTVLAAAVQLSAPMIALAGGVILLGETATLRLLIGAALVLGGIALTFRRRPSWRLWRWT